MKPCHDFEALLPRRHFLGRSATGLGMAALAMLLQEEGLAGSSPASPLGRPGTLRVLHHTANAKRVIYLFMSGGPSHIDLFDYKPELHAHHGEELPASVRMGQRITGMTSGQRSFPCVAPMFQFRPARPGGHLDQRAVAAHGRSSTTSASSNRCTPKRSTTIRPSRSFRPAISSPAGLAGGLAQLRPGEREPEPARVRRHDLARQRQPHRSAAFLAAVGQRFSAQRAPGRALPRRPRSGAVLVESAGASTPRRAGNMLDGTGAAQRIGGAGQSAIRRSTRASPSTRWPFACRRSVPELDRPVERAAVTSVDMYGLDRGYDDGGFARNCLLARRMVERGVRFVQLMHRGWDQHGNLPKQIRGQCATTSISPPPP